MSKDNQQNIIIEQLAESKDALESIENLTEQNGQKLEKKIEKLEETNKLLKELTEEIKKKEEFEISISSEDRLKLKGDRGDIGKRGSKFLGSFETRGELPDIDGIEIMSGDYAYVETEGEIWYAG